MNDEPVAWWARNRDTGIGYVQTSKPTRMDKVANEYIPLYANRQDLTDAEIMDFEYQIIRACGLSTANSDINPIGLRQIIKAILRKAQEK